MAKRLFIIGAGKFGRELESWLQLVKKEDRDWELAGFLDSRSGVLDGFPSDHRVLGDPFLFGFAPDDICVMGISDVEYKEKLAAHLAGKVAFLTFIAPSAIVGKFNKIGAGTVICPNCIVTTNVSVGDFVTVNFGTQIGHDCEIASYSSLMANADLGGAVKLGKSCFVGSGATVLPGTKTGELAIIGAGAVVVKNVEDRTTVFGNPAKRIASRPA